MWGTHEQELDRHLARLAWELRLPGVVVLIEVPLTGELCITVPRASRLLRVRATSPATTTWIFTWGRDRDQWVNALDERAPERVRKATQ